MLRLFDWACVGCGRKSEATVEVPHGQQVPKSELRVCPTCQEPKTHERLMSLTAPYLGERDNSPMVAGGRFDTMGRRQPPKLPTLPDGASAMDFKTLFSSPEYKEIRKERHAVIAENKQKQKRLAARRKGENISFARNRVSGDPKF